MEYCIFHIYFFCFIQNQNKKKTVNSQGDILIQIIPETAKDLLIVK